MKVTDKLDYNIAMSRQLDTIGRSIYIDFGRRATDVPAKIDTGADSSSVWASNIRVDKDGVLTFSLLQWQGVSANRLLSGGGKECLWA